MKNRVNTDGASNVKPSAGNVLPRSKRKDDIEANNITMVNGQ